MGIALFLFATGVVAFLIAGNIAEQDQKQKKANAKPKKVEYQSCPDIQSVKQLESLSKSCRIEK